MANKYTIKIKLKRMLILLLLSIICLTLVEAQGRVKVDFWGFEHSPAQNFIYFKESDNILNLDLSGNVWISSNAGLNWNLASGVPNNIAAALIKHAFSEDKAYILTIGKTHYKTSDKGKSWQEFTTPIPPAKKVKVLSFHAHREDYLLFRGTKCTGWFECTDVTYYTKDGFSTSPELLLENTDNCIWAHSSKKFGDAPEQSIFCIRYDVSGSGSMRKLGDYRLVESEDFFKDEETTKIIDFNSGGDVRGVIGLGESQEYLAAAVKDVNSFDMKLYVSVDGQKWARAFFPSKKGPKENAYTILESPSNHLVVDLLSSESRNTGTLFLSNSNGTYFVDRLEHTNRNDKGLVDFKISQSVGGILLANIVSNYEEVDKGSAIAKKLQSKISFDDGVTWNFIKPPDKNLGDSNFPCMNRGSWEQGECSLHLHSITSGRNNGHIFSANEAPGVLMGVGNVGPYLLPYDQCDTFLSYDGGLTWKVIRLGAHMYGIGHYGTLLVIVDDEQPTENILYSYDRGETWNSKPLGKMVVAKLLTTDSTSKNFLLLGSVVPNHDRPRPGDGSSNNRHFIFKLDFSELFNRDCNRDDFDDWVAKRSESGPDCFMGKKTTYHRRKAEARCFVTSQQPSLDNESCACAEKDFECDFNYILDNDKEVCIPLIPERIPEGECKDKDTYEGSSGYRKIPKNECDPDKPNSVRLDEPKTKKCSEGHSGPPLYGEVLHRTANFGVNNYFYFPESMTLMIQTIDGKIKRSTDEGSTWEDVLSEAGSIAYMFLHDHDKTKAYFFPDKADGKTYYMWFTTDSGNTFDKTELKNEPNKLNLKMLDFHPKEYDWLLFMAGTACPGCHSITYFSSDNGKSWKEIETWADKCIFGKDTEFSETENDAVFCSSYKDKNSKVSQDILGGRTSEANPLQLVKMKTDGGSKKVLFSDVVNFFVFNEFMAVATEERGQLLLHISEDGSKFSNATFPPDININQQAYTILPSATGSIFLDVYKSLRLGSEYGSLFKSNSDGTDFNRILDNTNRNVYGNVDFEKVQGLDGIILANQVVNVEELNNEYTKKLVITKISHDDGSHWKRLKFNGGDSSCQDCHLNLHGRTDIHGPGSIFSAPSAIGLLIGVGNYGRHLLPYNECNTFMSRDGGRTWREIRRGPSLYEFGDQGTIIVVVDNEAPTDHVLYSWNYGKDWEKYTFTTSTPVRVSLLTTNSNSTSMKFLLLGYTIQTSTREASPVVVTLDFSQLEKKKCDKDDYELWNPMDENSDDHTCLLGEETKFWRRKADAQCHIGESIPKPPERKTCKCTKHDFECAHGYWRNEAGQCELMGPDPDRPANCKDKYEGHSGYVKMKKSKCEGGDNLDKKIEKSCDSGNIIISKTKVFEQRIVEYFYFNETNTILARSMDNIVWRSTDEGYTWTSDLGISKEQKIYGIIQNPYFNNYAYLITLENKHYYTSDSGASFKELEVPINPNLLQIPILNFHSDKPEYLIYTGSIDCEDEWSQTCHTEAFYTRNNGKDWKSLDTYVRVCQWARNKKFKVHPDLIICESYLNKEGSQRTFFNNPLKLVSSNNFFKNKDTAPIGDIVGFTIYEEFMIVAELLPSGQSLRLLVSLDAKKFAEAQFPPNMLMTQNAYTVLESATYSITLHVTTSTNKYGNILKSNGNGTFYSFSLGYANRDDKGFVDFEKMQGIQGIALANVVGNVNEVNMGNNKKLKSMITTNDGATWKLLNRPEFDSNNNKYKCDGLLDKCALHLHSYTERRNPRDSFSSSSAIGLMMGVGNVGEYLTPYLEGDTFLTRDAGTTWIEVKKGAYMYEFGNQGGIIVLVDDEQTTDHILYSLNEGLSWQEYKFIKVGEQPIRVFDIDTMPGGLSSKFILRGLNPSRANEEVVVHLDFSHIFTRTCAKDDFERWIPKHQDNECLFGHKISYLRKIRENECFIENSLRHDKERGENCDCTDHDFECDYNYMRNAEGECVLVPGAQPLQRSVAEQCADGDGFWYELSGYRKLKASTCVNPSPKFGERHPCPGNHSILFWIIIVLSPFVIVGIVTICFINKRYGRTGGRIQLGSSIEPNSIIDMLYQIRMPRFITRLWSKIPLPGRRNRYYYSPVATDDGHDVLMDDYVQDNETL